MSEHEIRIQTKWDHKRKLLLTCVKFRVTRRDIYMKEEAEMLLIGSAKQLAGCDKLGCDLLTGCDQLPSCDQLPGCD